MVSTLNKTARPVSAPIMSPISIGETAPSPMVTSAIQVEHKGLVTPTRPLSQSGDNKVEVKPESCLTGTFKMQSVALEDTSEIKVHYISLLPILENAFIVIIIYYIMCYILMLFLKLKIIYIF